MNLSPEQKDKIKKVVDLFAVLIAEIFAAWLQQVIDRNVLKKLEK